MLCRKFKLIPIKIILLMNFKVALKSDKRLCTKVNIKIKKE